MAVRYGVDRVLLIWRASTGRWSLIYQSGTEKKEWGPLPENFRPTKQGHAAAVQAVENLLNGEG